ncbi:MAG: bifunctional oligoribonuclease/PAP phosphatase NrnA [Anaerolineaceae bacterium]|nr:bifunctional oligoribonuclease/PAP phosphatase NrnA [Anaerolineaceae bacterium]
MSLNQTNWTEATQAVEAAQSILIVTHVSPDGDAIGSALGLYNMLIKKCSSVAVAVDGGVPDFLSFLPHADHIQSVLTSGAWDLMISTDASDEDRTGQVGEYGRAHSKTIINLDHHATNTGFGDIYVVNPEVASAAEVVYQWWKQANYALDRDVAQPLLTGIVTDTLGFRTSNVKPATMAAAQELMSLGASLTQITAMTLDSRPYEVVDVWKRAMPSIELHDGVISANITLADQENVDDRERMEYGLVGWLRQVDEAMIAIVFTEDKPDQVKLSMRSKRGFDVSQVALTMGGGGHQQASGATVQGSLEEVRAKVMPLLVTAVKEGKLDIV